MTQITFKYSWRQYILRGRSFWCIIYVFCFIYCLLMKIWDSILSEQQKDFLGDSAVNSQANNQTSIRKFSRLWKNVEVQSKERYSYKIKLCYDLSIKKMFFPLLAHSLAFSDEQWKIHITTKLYVTSTFLFCWHKIQSCIGYHINSQIINKSHMLHQKFSSIVYSLCKPSNKKEVTKKNDRSDFISPVYNCFKHKKSNLLKQR